MDSIRKLLAAHHVNEISFRYSCRVPYEHRRVVSNSQDAVDVLRPHFSDHMEASEAFRILLLDRANRLKGLVTISSGGLTGTVADPRLIFGIACRTLSCGVILAHNHPSGQLRPSIEDLELTKRLAAAGRHLDIAVQDHLILTAAGFYSFADNGQI